MGYPILQFIAGFGIEQSLGLKGIFIIIWLLVIKKLRPRESPLTSHKLIVSLLRFL